jgi:uncharacterized membrane protein YecN with MAPEG domain
MPITAALYADLLGLSLHGKLNISVGDGGNRDLQVAVRRHANFTEWVPLALILIALLD